MVYVLNIDSKPLMTTNRCGHIRKLLKSGKASIVSYTPFAIKLNYKTDDIVQDVNLGVDIGSVNIGLSATSVKKELYAESIKLRTDIKGLLESRRGYRRLRRSRLRYRKPRFNNRKSSKSVGWISPTLENKIHYHIKSMENVIKILPISKIILETAKFDTSKLKDSNIVDYQHGELYNFYNKREYILTRDSYKCQSCKGKSKDKKLEVHHIIYKSEGGSDQLDNLITLCRTCHNKIHNGELKLKVKGNRKSYKDAAHVNIMRNRIIDIVCTKFSNIEIFLTYGYITKYNRINHNIEKSHINDAYCIAGNFNATRLDKVYYSIIKRKHNRKLFKDTIYKGNRLKRNQASYFVNGFCLWDKVQYNGQEMFIQSRRTNGWFELKESLLTKGTIRVKSNMIKLKQRNKTKITNILGNGVFAAYKSN